MTCGATPISAMRVATVRRMSCGVRVVSNQPLAAGGHVIRVKFEYEGEGMGKAPLLAPPNL
jgi:hypothetical protein